MQILVIQIDAIAKRCPDTLWRIFSHCLRDYLLRTWLYSDIPFLKLLLGVEIGDVRDGRSAEGSIGGNIVMGCIFARKPLASWSMAGQSENRMKYYLW
jgi:hypothetical protein